jgi:hypothetical protein
LIRRFASEARPFDASRGLSYDGPGWIGEAKQDIKQSRQVGATKEFLLHPVNLS